ncbi:MAG: hypothetical protein RL177_1124 [Bacteroidota bacterium]
MTRFLLILPLLLASCASSDWLTDKPTSYQGSSVYVRPIDASRIVLKTDDVSEAVMSRFTQTEADSLLHLLVNRTLRVPDSRYRDARMVSTYAESDFMIEIKGIEIRPSTNPLHRLVKNGPVVVVEVSTEVYRGEQLVYGSSTSDFANLAALASSEPGFHKATDREKNDPALQRSMVHKAYYSAVGDVMMSFFQVNRF